MPGAPLKAYTSVPFFVIHQGGDRAGLLSCGGCVVKDKKARSKGSLRWQVRLNRRLAWFNHPGFLSAAVIAIFGFAAMKWAVTRHDKQRTIIPAQPIAQSGSEDQPWAYFHPFWKHESLGALLPAALRMSDRNEIEGAVRTLVDDPKGRLERDFQVPAGLKSRVVFWMEIYSRYNSHMRVVHDRNNPAIIYGYIDFRPLYRALGSNAVVEAKANALEKKILVQMKARMRDSMGITNSDSVTADEKAQIQAFLSRAGAFSAKETEQLIKEVRTQSGQSDYFLQALYRSRNLLPHIESVFRQKALPVALGRIPFVESSFNAHAYSKGGAMGIWQFMPDTAHQMIHAREEKDFSDPLKQTASAARILQMYRSVLPDWGTTVTSYNSGVGRVRKIVEKYRLRDVEGLLQVPASDALGFAGKNFFSEFLAANLVEAYKVELFGNALESADTTLVFQSMVPYPKEVCDTEMGLDM